MLTCFDPQDFGEWSILTKHCSKRSPSCHAIEVSHNAMPLGDTLSFDRVKSLRVSLRLDESGPLPVGYEGSLHRNFGWGSGISRKLPEPYSGGVNPTMFFIAGSVIFDQNQSIS